MMVLSSALQLSLQFGVCSNQRRNKRFRREYYWSTNFTKRICRRVCTIPSRNHQFKCYCFLNTGPSLDATFVKNASQTLTRSINHLQGNPLVIKFASALGIVIFAIWGLGPLVRQSRNIFLSKSDSSWKRSSTYHVTTSYIQPLLLWTGVILICRALDPMILHSEAGQIVKQRLLNFVRSLSTILAFAHCLSSLIQQTQNFFMERNEPTDTRNMGFQFAARAVYSAVWVAAVSLFIELLGFSTQKWITAGGLGTVLLTLAGREIFTNFLSSVMIHATRPFVLNDWIQTKIGGYDISGTVEQVGWWSPTIVRSDDREAVHIPNHKFSVNIVRNISQKTHWRINTHLAISHLDVSKVNNIVADMRKVLGKNPQVEQQKLHRRVFLDNINPENQGLLIMVSCFVKTSRFEEYLCVKEAVLLDLLRVITHHRARLATPLRTVQKIYRDPDLDTVPFSDSEFTWGAFSTRPLLIEPSYKINGEDKPNIQAQSAHVNEDGDGKATPRTTQSTPESQVDTKGATTSNIRTKSGETEFTDYYMEMLTRDARASEEFEQKAKVETKNAKSPSDPKLGIGTRNSSTDGEVSSPNPNNSPGLTHNTSNKNHLQPQDGAASTSQPKQDAKQPLAQPLPSKPSLEENIVLGVALDGSKRSLPIDEDTMPPSSPQEMKELALLRGSSAPAAAEKEQGDIKRPNNPGSPAADQLDQQA